jgi:glycosyltransferase
MKITIITPAFNSAKTIADTVDSVKRQSYNGIEHIIVDGASRDETLAIVRKRSTQAIIISEPDNGIYDAMNKGIKQATGDLIGVLNSDDFYKNHEVIESVVEVFKARDCDALYGNLVYVDATHTDRVVRSWQAGEFQMGKFLNGWMPPHPTFFVKRECYEKYGTYDTELKSSADYELMLRFLYRYQLPVAYLPLCMVCMRTGGQSNASLKNRLQANREDRLAWKKNGLEPRFYTTWLKPIRKIPQFIK